MARRVIHQDGTLYWYNQWTCIHNKQWRSWDGVVVGGGGGANGAEALPEFF